MMSRPKHWPGLRTALLSCMSIAALASAPAVQAETLQEALISAYNSHPRLMAERARVREIDENYIQARGQGRLSSSISGSVGYSALRRPDTNFQGQPTGTFTTTASEPHSAQLQVIQPIYQGGRVRALKSQAMAGVLAAREGLRNTEQGLFLNVAIAYSDVQRDERAASIRRNNVSVLSRQLQAATDRFDVGEGTRTDIAQAETRLAAAEIGLAQADAQLQVSRSAFIRNVGHPPVELSPLPTFVMPATLDAAMYIARENNPQLIASMLNEQAAEAAIDVAKAFSRPTVSLNGSLATAHKQISGIPRAETGTIAAQITIPIFSGGINRSRVRAAGHARTRSMFETRDTERALDDAVMQIWAQLDAARRSLVASEAQVKAAEFAFEGVELEQQVGTRSALDVLNAEQELLNAKLSQINAKASLREFEFQLLATLGAFDAESMQLPIDTYDPAENLEYVQYLGMKKAVDTYVPIAAQKIGSQLPNIPKDIVGLGINAANMTKIPEITGKIVRQLPNIPHDIAVLFKEKTDDLTGQSEKPAPSTIELPDN